MGHCRTRSPTLQVLLSSLQVQVEGKALEWGFDSALTSSSSSRGAHQSRFSAVSRGDFLHAASAALHARYLLSSMIFNRIIRAYHLLSSDDSQFDPRTFTLSPKNLVSTLY